MLINILTFNNTRFILLCNNLPATRCTQIITSGLEAVINSKDSFMSTLNEKESRDFISQVIVIVGQNSGALADAGYDPTNRSEQLKTKLQTADEAEGEQQKAQAVALEATKRANTTLKEAYDDASAMVNLIEGLLGKDNGLVHKLRQLRKN